VPGIVVLRIESGLFFANIESVRAQLSQAAMRPGTKTIVLDPETIPFIDVSAARMLDELATELKRDGVHTART